MLNLLDRLNANKEPALMPSGEYHIPEQNASNQDNT